MKRLICLITAAAISATIWPSDGQCGKVYVGAETKVDVLFKAPLSTSEDKPQDLSAILEIAKSDTVAGIEVFRKGGKVYGEVLEYVKPGHLGKPGSIRVRIDSLQTVQGRNIGVKPLGFSAVGKARKVRAYLMLPLLGYGYFVKGGDALLGEAGQVIPVRTAKFEELGF